MRIAVISDVHSNLHALDAVLADAGAVDAIWHLGDIVGYGPEPDAVVDRLTTRGAIGVRGNHDAAACGGDEIDWFNTDARAAMEWTRRTISTATLAWLRDLPQRLQADDFTLVHGSPLDPTWEYVTTTGAARESLGAISTTHGLNGHTHVPIAFGLDGDRMATEAPAPCRGWTSTVDGCCSIPAASGSRATVTRATLVLDLEARRVSWARVAYDIDAVRSRMRSLGLPGRLSERLRYGY
jgi:predicted phosphodiesterase